MPQSKISKNTLQKEISFGRIGLGQKAVVTGNLAIMLKSGLSLSEALDVLQDQFSGKLKFVINNIARSVQAGNSLAVSFAKFPRIFSAFFINTVKAGEASGTLEENLSNLAAHLKQAQELKEKIKSAMVYPVIVLSLAFVIGMLMTFMVLPKITPIFSGLDVELPLTTQALIWLSHNIEESGWIILLAMLALGVFFVWFFSRQFIKPFTHAIFLRLPIVGLLSRNKNLAQFSQVLSTLLFSGINIDQAALITSESMDNYYFAKALKDASQQLGQGAKLSDILEQYSQYFPRLTISLIRVGERSGKLEEGLKNLAETYKTEVDHATKRLTVSLEPILLIVIGLVVGLLALAIITPIYKITGNIYK